MTGAATWGAGIPAPEVRGKGPAGRGRRAAASRRRSLGLLLVFVCGASAAGAVLGLVKQPNPGDQAANFAFTTAAAVETARRADERARRTEAELAAARLRIDALSADEQELSDYREAERIGVSRWMKDSTALWGDERRRVMAAIIRESRRNGLDPALVAAVIQVESHFDPFAVSAVGARGLMQLMPPTAQWLLQRDPSPPKIHPSQLFNPVLNIELGTTYLAHLMTRFEGDLTRALIAYNAGPTTARALQRGSRSWYRLHAYPRNVLAAYKALLTVPQQVAAR
jgi:soluble lytic murein transglycosylase-like protein